mgnify:CR=1 FL=1
MLDEALEEPGLGDLGHHRTYSQVAGHQLATWGTSTAGGMKQCYQTPSEKLKALDGAGRGQTINLDDRMTVATASSGYTALSAAPSSVISRQCHKL